MAKTQVANFIAKPKTKRKGVHAKTKTSKSKNSQNYSKPYMSQGK